MDDSLDHFVDSVVRECETPEDFIDEQAGAVLGPYTLVEKIGVGGFGVVWRAEQTAPVRRQVAVKIIKVGMDTREVVSRFRAERQTLAVLQHPGIAKIFDAGATPGGRPYFAMELLHGLTLTSHSAEHHLPPAEKLRLFVDVCRAVQHAHLKGVIHRDLKPSNVLVSEVDGKAQPKVIDFGIAKITDDSEAAEARTYFTREDRFIGTPAYMSPEQFLPGMDIDARSDIYSLGVVLYELITGRLPHPVDAKGQIDRSRSPARPSTIQGSGRRRFAFVKIANRSLREGRSDLPADLDWVVLKALSEDRTMRYDSADALASDIEACLDSRPVVARPPTTWYLLKRFARRNRLLVGAASAIFLVLLAGIVGTTAMYLGQRKALVRSEEVSRFMKEILEQASVSKSRGRDTTMMREILDETATRISTELAGFPDVQADLHGVIGRTYEDIDEYELALVQTTEQLLLRRQIHGENDHPELATALVDHASVIETLGKPKDAEPFILEALSMRQRLYGDGHPLTGEAHAIKAWILVKSGRSAEGEASALLAYQIWRKDPADERLSDAANALSTVYRNTKKYPQAVEIGHENVAAMRRVHGDEHPQVVNALDNLGHDLVIGRRFEEAEPILLECIRLGQIVHRDRSPVEDHAYGSLTLVAASRQDWDKELEYARGSFAAAERVFSPGHRYYREGSGVLSRVLMQQAERFAVSDPLKSREKLDELRKTPGLAGDLKTHAGWIECLEAHLLSRDPARREEAKKRLVAVLGQLKSKAKPSAEDLNRIKKAEGWLAKW
jgi:eukaryotic-like serine/threonine-protein kinase